MLFVPLRMNLTLLYGKNQSVVSCIEAMMVQVAPTLYLDEVLLSTAKTNNLSQKEIQNLSSQSFPSEPPKLHLGMPWKSWNALGISMSKNRTLGTFLSKPFFLAAFLDLRTSIRRCAKMHDPRWVWRKM